LTDPWSVKSIVTLFRHPSTKELDSDWIDRYRARRTIQRPVLEVADVEPDPPRSPVEPHDVQVEALKALEATRAEGNHAGLVVLATGLGKTWLSAFDTNRPDFKRVLFVAHREEILDQALAAFRRIRPGAVLGHFTGERKEVQYRAAYLPVTPPLESQSHALTRSERRTGAAGAI